MSTSSPRDPHESQRLVSLEAGQRIPYGGCRWVEVSSDLAAAFGPGDHVVVVQETGDLLHIPQAVVTLTEGAVAAARQGFVDLQNTSPASITGFFESFARRLEDDAVFSLIANANAVDVERAQARGRSTTRLVLDEKMRRSMVEALRMWRDVPDGRDRSVDRIEHRTSQAPWTVDERRAPLGVVGFVFEGRPNVFADATGVLRSGNSVVFRIGSDALGTARAMMESALVPALVENHLPLGSVVLLDSPERSAGHALFAHPGLSLAVARGSGEAVAQLGAVARQSGVPVSLHGTGGAWMLIAPSASPTRLRECVEASLDRKVCNTLNVCCVPVDRPDLLDAMLAGAVAAADWRGATLRVHAVGDGAAEALSSSSSRIGRHGAMEILAETDDAVLATEWEWEHHPELSVRLVENWRDGLELFNRWSPQFIVSVQTADEADVEAVYRLSNAPFVGDGFTRWVDGQYALNRPELGLSNWQSGRLFARGGILSGDGVFSVRYLAHHDDSRQRR
ncbi:MAG: aldehyde dehydrogenase family protein [Ilumatobacteraceae bacterium]